MKNQLGIIICLILVLSNKAKSGEIATWVLETTMEGLEKLASEQSTGKQTKIGGKNRKSDSDGGMSR
jgi:hypothetical protein